MAQPLACKTYQEQPDGKNVNMVQTDTYRIFDTGRPIKWGLAIALFIAAALLIGAGTPRLLAEISLVPGTPIYYDVVGGNEADRSQLDLLINSRQEALRYSALPKAHHEMAVAYFRLADSTIEESLRAEYQQLGIATLRKSLDMKPANSFGWLRLCRMLLVTRQEPPEAALDAWLKSVQFGEFDNFMMYSRVHLGILLYEEMSESQVDILRQQMLHAWGWQRYSFRTYMEQNSLIPWAEFILRDSPEKVDFMQRKEERKP